MSSSICFLRLSISVSSSELYIDSISILASLDLVAENCRITYIELPGDVKVFHEKKLPHKHLNLAFHRRHDLRFFVDAGIEKVWRLQYLQCPQTICNPGPLDLTCYWITGNFLFLYLRKAGWRGDSRKPFVAVLKFRYPSRGTHGKASCIFLLLLVF